MNTFCRALNYKFLSDMLPEQVKILSVSIQAKQNFSIQNEWENNTNDQTLKTKLDEATEQTSHHK